MGEKLKEARLEWKEGKAGDWYFHPMVGVSVNTGDGLPFDGEAGTNCIYLPSRLDLEERLMDMGWRRFDYRYTTLGVLLFAHHHTYDIAPEGVADTAADAVAKAYLTARKGQGE